MKQKKEVGEMTDLKKEMGENDKFIHLQNIFTHLQQK